ncbi:hypothetical protein H7992_14355 [Sporosarcina sp. resist]|uniref:hypothetical protein n=1 Tax=Sporosarcina sp. resist TaxID=2762563 RepID=UPI00164EA440|nr:hypothetical protein [Sporosarcina sp. resist]QNK86441.1 hypothetical protein H7992_14355 [Sporosarcina sp. resist]
MNPEYYNNKNIIKYLEGNFGKVNAKSDISINNFKRSIKLKYSKERLQEIHRKITLHNLRMELSADMNMVHIILGSFLAGLITMFITYITISINQVYFMADKQLSINPIEKLTEEEKTKVLDDISGILQEGTAQLMSMGMIFILSFLIPLIITALILVFIQTKRMYTRRVFEMIIKECVEESEVVEG